MNNIILYTTHCPKCKVLEAKLQQKNVAYTEITDVKTMEEKNIEFVPVLEIDGEMMDFTKANAFINKL